MLLLEKAVHGVLFVVVASIANTYCGCGLASNRVSFLTGISIKLISKQARP